MPVVQPTQPRATLTDTTLGLVVTIPVKRNRFALLFLPVWLVGWAFGEAVAAANLIDGDVAPEARVFLMVWLAFWTLGGGAAVLAVLWMLAGRERITLGAAELGIRRELFGLGREKKYELVHCRNVRVSAATLSSN